MPLVPTGASAAGRICTLFVTAGLTSSGRWASAILVETGSARAIGIRGRVGLAALQTRRKKGKGVMVFLPIVEREFRRATKRRRTYWIRTGAAIAAALVGIVTVSRLDAWIAAPTVGRALFTTASAVCFWLCLFTGVFSTSICLSEEKRHGTLGLLFLTDLKGYDVVAGKLANVSLNSVQTLIGILPVLALSMVLGGVSGGEFWRMVLVLLSTLLFSLATGMFASAVSVHPVRAMSATLCLLVLFTAPSSLVDHLLFSDLRANGTDYLLPGPYQAYALVWDGRYQLPPNNFLPSILCTFAMSAAQLTLASHTLPRTFQQKVYPSLWQNWRQLKARICPNDPSATWEARRRMLRINPVYWMQVRYRHRWFYIWGVLALVIVVWLVALACLGFTGRRMTFAAFMCLTPFMHSSLKIAIGAAASTRLNEARTNGELESLMVTPLRTRTIYRGHILALQRQFALPVVLVLGIDAALLLFGHSLTIEDSDQSAVRCLALWAMMVMLIVDAYALAWVGLWEGLHTKNIFVATRRTLVSVLVLPWVFLIPTTFLAPPALISETVLGGFAGWFAGVAVWWGVIGFLVDFYYYNRCHRNLRNEFRKVVAEWFAPPVPTHRLDRYGLREPWRAPSYRYY